MLRLSREREVLRVLDDQRGCLTRNRDLAGTQATICQRLMQGRNFEPWGISHLCGAGQTAWYGFAQAIFGAAQAFEPLQAAKVVPFPSTSIPPPANDQPTQS